MSTLTIRGLDDTVKARLRVRAAHNGRSMEAEARAILRAALEEQGDERGLGTQLHELFAGLGGDDLQFEWRKDRPRIPDFGE